MTARLDYRWHLRKVMADRGMFSTTDLIGPLAQRGITLSSSQVYRLVTERPARLSLKILMALLDILDCTNGRPHRARRSSPPGPADREGRGRRGRGHPGDRRPATEASADHRHGAVTVGGLLALMAELEPTLSAEAVLGALGQAAARHDGRWRIAAAVTAQPGLLTGEGASAPVPGVLRFISALASVGATSVVEPPCPRCGRQRQLGGPVEGLRLCAGCRSKARAVLCGRCGKVRQPARLNHGGQPVCVNCWHRDPRSWKPCAKCGNPRRSNRTTR